MSGSLEECTELVSLIKLAHRKQRYCMRMN
jgi:hypothetical protein